MLKYEQDYEDALVDPDAPVTEYSFSNPYPVSEPKA